MANVTAEQIANAANSLLEFNMKGQAMSQVLQDRPLYRDLMARKKTVPGGLNRNITMPVKGQYTTSAVGFEGDDDVGFASPANTKRLTARWNFVHAGITFTMTELAEAGINVVDSNTGEKTNEVSRSDAIILTNLLQEKFDDLIEGSARSTAEMFWRDGTQDSKAIAGIQSFLTLTPTTGTVFGIDAAQNSWWRNRTSLAIDSSTASNQNLVNTLQSEVRQLRRYGGRPSKMYCGSTFIEAYEKELRSKGNYTLRGFSGKEAVDAGMADVEFKGIMLEYDPLLDDLGYAKYCYMLDMSKLAFHCLAEHDWKKHWPSRPPEKYVFYHSMTLAGAIVTQQRNAHGIYSIA